MTLGETKVTGQGDPQATAQTSQGKEGSTSTAPRIYTEEQARKLVSDALAEQGRKHKTEVDPIVKERDTLKSQITNKDTELADIATEREKLQTQIDELASNDPEKFNIIKKDKELREQERKLKADRQTLETEKATNAETVNEATKWKRDQLVYTVADEFVTAGGEDVDKDSFMTAADKFKLSDREGLVALAETMGLKLKTEPVAPEVPPVKPYSGMTDGGADDDSKLSPREKIEKGLEIAKLKKK